MAKKLPKNLLDNIPLISDRYTNGGESCSTLAKEYGVCTATLWNVLQRAGVKTRSNKKLAKAQKQQLIDLYKDGLSTYKIGEVLNVDACTVQRWLDKLDIEKRSLSEATRTYSIDETYFDEIDTEDKAYFLGWLYSDGCNSTYDNKGKNRYNIVLQLQKRDKEILDAFLSHMKSNAPLSYVAPRAENEQGYYRMSVYNKHMSQTLEKHGVTANKTFTVTYPTWLPEELQHHFIRGVFDGDGNISLYSKRKRDGKFSGASISIIGTENLCNNMWRIMHEELRLPAYITDTHDTDERIRTIRIDRKDSVYKFMEWMYKDATIWLSRKKDKYNILKQELC